MKEWFKARNIWYGAFVALTDAEAGRLAKALWTYTATGEEVELSGNEKGCFAMIKFTLQMDDNERDELSDKRRAAGLAGALAKQANATFASDDEAKPANATNKNKNQNKKENTPPRSARAREDTPLGPVDLDPLILKLQQELNGMTDNHYQALNDYREQLGDDLVSHAVDEAVGNGVRNWTYVEKILSRYLKEGIRDLGEAKASDERRKQDAPLQKPRLLRAQDYEQREYVEDEMKKILDVHALYR